MNKTELKGPLRSFIGGDSDMKVNNIALVGAVADIKNPYLTTEQDNAMLYSSLIALRVMGREVSESCTVETYNMAKEYGGRDFLDPQEGARADVVVMCFVDRTVAENADFKTSIRREYGETTAAGVLYSEYELHGDTPWNDAAKRAGAHTVITFGKYEPELINKGEVVGRCFTDDYNYASRMGGIVQSVMQHPISLYRNIYEDRPMEIMTLKL